jgi:hypothetical protein
MKMILALVIGSSIGCNLADRSTNSLQSAESSEKTLSTIVSCEQDDGDQWRSVGIVINDGQGMRALVVQNGDNSSSNILITEVRVEKSSVDGQTIYKDEADSFKLIIKKAKRSKRLVGALSILADGQGGLSLTGMNCFEKSQIRFSPAK